MALLGLIFKFLVALLLWPLAACLGYAFEGRLGAALAGGATRPGSPGGFVLYLLVQALFWRPLFLYVMGHELTHALAAVIQGGQADDLRVSTKGGMVKVNVSNFLVNLAPYFFPIYTAAAALIYLIAADPYKPYLVGLIGFTLAFHFALTLYSLKQHQSDITEVGWLFALPFIASHQRHHQRPASCAWWPADSFNFHRFFQDTWVAAQGRSAVWVRGRLVTPPIARPRPHAEAQDLSCSTPTSWCTTPTRCTCSMSTRSSSPWW